MALANNTAVIGLVYYESFDDVGKAIDREKQLKRWSRSKKVWLIEQLNPTWEGFGGQKTGPSTRQLICFANQLTRSG